MGRRRRRVSHVEHRTTCMEHAHVQTDSEIVDVERAAGPQNG